MIEGKKILGIIPARGGSKGVPGKNLRLLGGKPLIAWTIEAAKKSRYLDHLILSSDDLQIIATARQWGCEVPFVRPSALGQDDTPATEVLLHALEEIPGFDFLVFLQPTSPLRTSTDIDECIERCFFSASKSCVSLTESEKNPFWIFSLDDHCTMSPLMAGTEMPARRQDSGKFYSLNGAVYVCDVERFLQRKTLISAETVGYVMPKERSVDIDTELDLKFAELLIG